MRLYGILTSAIVLVALSCTHTQNQYDERMRILEQSLEYAATSLHLQNQHVLDILVNKRKDPHTAVKAEYWLMIATRAIRNTAELVSRIRTYQKNISKNDKMMAEVADSVHTDLTRYLDSMESLEPVLQERLKQFSTPLRQLADSNDGAYFRNLFAYETTALQAHVLLTKINSDAETLLNRAINEYDQQCISCASTFDASKPLIIQSTTRIVAGDALKITAGIGLFSSDAKPKIFIDGHQLELNEQGYVEFTRRPTKPGRHSIPVHYEWISQVGTPQTFDDRIEYTVLEKN